MKRLSYILFLVIATIFVGCELEPEVQVSENPIPATITFPEDGTAYSFGWDNNDELLTVVFDIPEFGFPVVANHTVQIDVHGGSFEKPRSLGIVPTDTLTYKVKKLNSEIKKLKFEDGEVAQIDLRILTSINSAIDKLASDVITLTFVPYSEPVPLTSLYMIGAAVGEWNPEKAVDLRHMKDEQFKHIWYFDNANGRNFRFFTEADWAKSLGGYDIFPNYPTELLEAATEDDDPNFNFIGEPGWYMIDVDIPNGTITMEPAKEQVIYLTGDATHGWGWDDPVTQISYVGYQTWEGEVTFIQNNAFRLFSQKDWSPSFGWDVVTNYDTSVIDKMEGHDDPNWQFLGESGVYKVKLDLYTNTIEITQ